MLRLDLPPYACGNDGTAMGNHGDLQECLRVVFRHEDASIPIGGYSAGG